MIGSLNNSVYPAVPYLPSSQRFYNNILCHRSFYVLVTGESSGINVCQILHFWLEFDLEYMLYNSIGNKRCQNFGIVFLG